MSYLNFMNSLRTHTSGVPFGGRVKRLTTQKTQNHVLILEDDVEITALLNVIKEKHQLPIEIVTSSGEALSLVAKKSFDAMVLDWNLPDFNADMFLRLSESFYFNHCLKHDYERKLRVPVITFTGENNKVVKMPRSQFFHKLSHWAKPLSIKTLEDRIVRLVKEPIDRVCTY